MNPIIFWLIICLFFIPLTTSCFSLSLCLLHVSFIFFTWENTLVKTENTQQNLSHYNVLLTEQLWKLKSKCVKRNHRAGEENNVSLMGHHKPEQTGFGFFFFLVEWKELHYSLSGSSSDNYSSTLNLASCLHWPLWRSSSKKIMQSIFYPSDTFFLWKAK